MNPAVLFMAETLQVWRRVLSSVQLASLSRAEFVHSKGPDRKLNLIQVNSYYLKSFGEEPSGGKYESISLRKTDFPLPHFTC